MLIGVNALYEHRIFSKLQDALQNLKPLEDQGKVAGFLNNAKDAEALTGLAEDVRDAMMDYQVCSNTVFG